MAAAGSGDFSFLCPLFLLLMRDVKRNRSFGWVAGDRTGASAFGHLLVDCAGL